MATWARRDRRYRDANASTDDFGIVMEQTSGRDLSWFFDQWLRRPSVPQLSGTWRYDPAARRITVQVSQVQTTPPYRLPLEIGVTSAAGTTRVERVELTGASGTSANCRRSGTRDRGTRSQHLVADGGARVHAPGRRRPMRIFTSACSLPLPALASALSRTSFKNLQSARSVLMQRRPRQVELGQNPHVGCIVNRDEHDRE
jgi:hypothetical protein